MFETTNQMCVFLIYCNMIQLIFVGQKQVQVSWRAKNGHLTDFHDLSIDIYEWKMRSFNKMMLVNPLSPEKRKKKSTLPDMDDGW